MNEILLHSVAFLAVFIVGELLMLLVFRPIKLTFEAPAVVKRESEEANSDMAAPVAAKVPWINAATWRGLLERLMVFLGLAMGIPHIITAFSALKVGSRLPTTKVSLEYFLVGSIISLLFALLYFKLFVLIVNAFTL